MSDCIFCKIINHEIPGKIVYEDDICLAFLDLSQTTDGHTLVIPKKHYDNILDVDSDTLGHMMKVVQIVAKNIENKLGAKGFNIISNMNEIAGQSVHHFHIHIIPRYNLDEGFKAIYGDRSDEVDLEEIYTKLTK
ncbi:MAG: HIT family protein [Erysipelotrichaceae bacterium]|nr:HIT family protein [Erysipelotrichaceae bacterium]